MKYCWQISKCDFEAPDAVRRYLCDSWTSASDIGKKFHDQPLTKEQYVDTEDRFVAGIKAFLLDIGIQRLRVGAVEMRPPPPAFFRNEGLLDVLDGPSVAEGDLLDLHSAQRVLRMVLREMLWCEMNANEKLEIHFGHDYVVTIESEVNCPNGVQQTRALGLFVRAIRNRR